ncbi:MAG: hypothetical protein HEEMFOPI_00520 [Holosporales bacterium]
MSNYINPIGMSNGSFLKKGSSVFNNTSFNKQSVSFKDELVKTGQDVLSKAKHTESLMNEFTKGNISPETVITSTKETALELEGGMAVVKTAVESIKQILNIQI